jgi:hypothetical protein
VIAWLIRLVRNVRRRPRVEDRVSEGWLREQKRHETRQGWTSAPRWWLTSELKERGQP